MLAAVNRPRSLFRTRFASLALLGALTFGSACTKANDETAKGGGEDNKAATPDAKSATVNEVTPPAGPVVNPTDSSAVAETGEVIATVQIPSGTAMTDVAAVLDSVQPGASAMLKMQVPSALEQAVGFDLQESAKLDAPMSLVVLDPSSHPDPIALLVEAKDAAALSEAAKQSGKAVEQQGDLLLIGPEGVVAAAKDFAFTNLTKYSDHTEIILYPGKLLGSYSGQIAQALDGMGATMGAAAGNQGMAEMVRKYFEGLLALGEQTERLVISVSSTPGSADLIVRAYPTAGSTFAKFVAAQAPSDHALLAKLPAGGGTMLVSGNFQAGEARDSFVKFAFDVMAPMYGGTTEEWTRLMTPWLDSLGGPVATSVTMSFTPSAAAPTMQMQSLMGVSDTTKLGTAWREFLTKIASGPGFEMMGMKVTARHEVKVLEHDGVEVDLYASKIDTSGMAPDAAAAVEKAGTGNQAMHMAAFDSYAAMATADDSGKAITAVIDAARGKGDALELSPTLRGVLDASKQRGDSIVVYLDIATMMAATPTPPPQPIPFKAVSMSFGKYESALSMRLSLLE